MADEKKPKCHGEDVLFMGPPLNNGLSPFLRHRSDCSTETGLARVVREGEPLHNRALLLERRKDSPGTFNVRGTYSPDSSQSGPPKVATPEYRTGWDRIFGGSPTIGQA
jgi:hypothetical protein